MIIGTIFKGTNSFSVMKQNSSKKTNCRTNLLETVASQGSRIFHQKNGAGQNYSYSK